MIICITTNETGDSVRIQWLKDSGIQAGCCPISPNQLAKKPIIIMYRNLGNKD